MADRVLVAAIALASAAIPGRLFAQDTAAIDRGVRIGIVYRPGVRPGIVHALVACHQKALNMMK